MSLAELFKGLVLSQGYVTTPERLREVAPEALPAPAAVPCLGSTAAVRRPCTFVPMVRVQFR